MNLTPETIRKCLLSASKNRSRQSRESRDQDQKAQLISAAVLLPLFSTGDGWQVLFIKRSEQDHDHHGGQIAFPGGRVEKDDSNLLDTALREAKEEINLQPQDVNILGALNEISTVTHYRVTPFVGQIPWPYPLKPDPREVERTLSIPLNWLAAAENKYQKNWKRPGRDGKSYPVDYFLPYEEEVLWGASARIILDFLEAVSEKPPTGSP